MTPADEQRPFALPVEEFVAASVDAPPPLIGGADDCILPAYGLLLYVAKGGKGKTTSTLDAILHLASGRPWLNFEVPRPLRVLLIENEGPREPFRRKLERRLSNWPYPLEGAIHVYSDDWGQARLDEAGFIERLNRYVAEHAIDLVVGDPLDTLGMEGTGSPKDTRRMVSRLQEAGLFTRTAWWILHHARKDRATDAIDEASGSWGGKPDALLGLERLSGDRARLGFHKLRWGRRDGFSYLLAYDADSEEFELLEEDGEGGDSRDYVVEITKLLSDGEARTISQIAERRDGGIGANKDTVRGVLEGNPKCFVSCTGEAAKAEGRRSSAIIWQLTQASESVESVSDSLGASAKLLTSGSPHREPEVEGQPGTTTERLTQRSKSEAKRSGCASHRDSPAENCRYCRAASKGLAR